MCQKNTLAEFCCSVTAKQEKTQMSQQQLGGFTSRWCNSFLCFPSFVRPHRRTRASCSLAFWERPYTEERIPPAHVITQYITSLRMPPSCVCIRVCVCQCSVGPSALAESGRTGGAARHKDGEKSPVWISRQWLCVRMCVSESGRMNEITSTKTLWSRWLSLCLRSPGTGRPMSDFTTVASFCYTV